MRRTLKRVSLFPLTSVSYFSSGWSVELDALALEPEEEGVSYLADLNKAPDFIDEAPIEAPEVRTRSFVTSDGVLTPCLFICS